MTNSQKNSFKMLQEVATILGDNEALLRPVPGFSQLYVSYQEGINKIKRLSEIQVLDKSGLVEQKQLAKQLLALKAFRISARLQVYARLIKNKELLNEIDFTESDLKYANDEDLRKYARIIYTKAKELIDQLEKYEITAEGLSDLKLAIEGFNEAWPKVGITAAKLQESTAKLKLGFTDMGQLLEDMDAVMELTKEKSPDLYKEYKRVRKIKRNGIGHLSVKGKVSDALSGTPIQNAIITIKLKKHDSVISLNGNGTLYKKSALKGGFNINSLPPGIYDVSISKNGYAEQKTSLAVNDGEMSRIEVALDKA